MSVSAVVLTYHAVEPGQGSLFVDPELFAAHLDCIVESGVRVTTVSALGAALRAGSLEDRTVAITFDDGLASVARVAGPLLAARGLVATVFCVAGHLGGTSDWASAPSGSPKLEVACATELEVGWKFCISCGRMVGESSNGTHDGDDDG